MKRILTLATLFALAFAVKAQVNSLQEVAPNKAYTLYNPHFTTYAVYNAQKSTSQVWAAGMTLNASDTGKTIADNSYKQALDASAPSSSWMIVQYNEQWYVYNLGAQKFLAVGYNPATAATAAAKLQDEPAAIEFTQKQGGGFHLRTHQGTHNYLCVAPQLAYPISIWTNTDNGATWQIEENTQVEADYETCMQKLRNAIPETASLTINTKHGYVWSGKNGGPMPERIYKGRDLTFYTRARNGWNCTDGLTIKVGDNEFKVENINEGAYATEVTIPGEMITDDVVITGVWKRDASVKNAQLLSFSDEFDGTGEPTLTKWSRTARQGATWNRWCSDSPLVVYREDGYLHCRAVPNPDRASDNVPMITGGVKTQGKFDFQWGRAEARIKTIAHTGSFPAFWMMPTDGSAGWPSCGEIDIWETIDDGTVAYGTVHSHWTYDLGKGGNGGTKGGMDYDLWHIYAIEWNATSITWYVDGEKMFTYEKSKDQSVLNQGQWPFDKAFYLILNQSVGNGSWARPADESFTYETLFDWVRVYQRPEYTAIEDVLIDETDANETVQKAEIYDLSGRKLSSAPQNGVYVYNGQIVMK